MRRRSVVIAVMMFALFSICVLALSEYAGSTDPTNPPASTSSFTLEDIYNRLNNGTTGTQSTFTEPAAGPGTPTMYTLNEIMAKAPAANDANGAITGDVANGKTFWGLNVTGGEWGLQTGTAAAARVPKTGQTTKYADRDDGDLEKGVAWPSPRFTDNLDGTVTDNLTGLIWLKNANCSGKQTWANALVSANTLNSGECGLSDGSAEGDWRLPNVQELHSLIDFSQYNPALPSGHPFSSIQSDSYWSSTTCASATNNAWRALLTYGSVNGDLKTTTYYVWPVRGGQ